MERYNINDVLNTALNGDALTELRKLPDESVHCVVTSPPYFNLRNYGTDHKIWDDDPNCEHDFSIIYKQKQTGGTKKSKVGNNIDDRIHYNIKSAECSKCHAWKGELGQEPRIDLYINHLIQIFTEVKRVLTKTGSLWVVISDSYSKKHRTLLKIPARFEIAMIDDGGWFEPNEIIWKKRNCMPSSAKRRFTIDFEKVFLFTKSDDYFFKEQYEPYETGINNNDKPRKPGVQRVRDEKYLSKYATSEYRGTGKKDYHENGVQNPSDVKRRILASMKKNMGYNSIYNNLPIEMYSANLPNATAEKRIASREMAKKLYPNDPKKQQEFINYVHDHGGVMKTKIKFGGNKGAGGDNATYSGNEWVMSPKGRIARAVWEINTQPSPLKHYAIFPEKLVRKCLDPGCPEMICDACDTPYKTIFDEEYFATRPGLNTLQTDKSGKDGDPNKELHRSHWSKYKPIVVRNNFKLIKDCKCETEDYHKGIVLDIFGGTGTTALVAKKMHRNFILIEPKKEYIGFIEKRLREYDEKSGIGPVIRGINSLNVKELESIVRMTDFV